MSALVPRPGRLLLRESDALLLLGPRLRQCFGEAGDREIRRGGAINDRRANSRPLVLERAASITPTRWPSSIAAMAISMARVLLPLPPFCVAKTMAYISVVLKGKAIAEHK
jgi:hypothetical protein